MAEPVPRRLIPSHREVEAGDAVRDFEPAVDTRGADELTRRERAAAAIRDLDPRRVTEGSPAAPAYLLFLLLMLGGWDDAAFQVFIPEIRRALRFDIGFVVVLGSLVTLATQLLGPFTGYLADRVNRVRMVVAGAVVANLSSVVTGLAPSLPVLALSRFTAGAGQGLVQPAGLPLLTDWYPLEKRARVFSFVFTGFLVGVFAGPPLAGLVGDRIGWRATIAGFAVIATGAGIAFAFLREPARGAGDHAVASPKPVSWAEGWRAARSIVTLRRIWFATPFLTAGSTVLNAVTSLYYAQEFGASPTLRGLIGGITGAAAVIGLTVSGPVSDRILATRPSRVFTVLGLIMAWNAVAVTVMAVSPSIWLSVAVSLPVLGGAGLIVPAQFTLTSMVIPPRLRAFGLQTLAPWQVVGLLIVVGIGGFASAVDVRAALAGLAPIYVVAAVLITGAGAGVDRDIRAARAAAEADAAVDRARQEGVSKLLVCRDVDVTYEGTQVLFHVDLDLEEGELVALLGTNGAGKSTLLRAIAGLQEASNGAIFLDGDDVTHRPAHHNAREGVVYMPGGKAVFPSLTVAENLRAAAWLHRHDEAAVAARTEEVLNLFPPLRERLDDRAGDLSGGEQQMVALSQAFLMRPRLLMIDELSLGLAPAVVEQLLEVVRGVNEQGTTVVLVEQSVNVALTIARRAVFMDKGEVRFDGPTGDLLRRSDLMRSVFLSGTGGSGGRGPFIASGTGLRRPRDRRPPEEVLAVEGVRVSFGGRRALDGASLRLDGAEVLGIIGPNGAGKTTLFDVISGFVRPEEGRVVLAGADVTGLRPDQRAWLGLGRSFQNAQLFPTLTVRENIAVALERTLATRSTLAAATWLPAVRRAERRAARRVDHLVDLLHLDAYANKFVAELSTGTRRMVDVACIMAAEPAVLLLDEPSSGLAQAEVEVLGPVVRRLARETGCGVVVIEHDIPLVQALSDRLLALELGAVLVEGDPADVLADQRVVEAYLGTSAATVHRSGDVLASVLAQAGLLTPEEEPDAGAGSGALAGRGRRGGRRAP